MEEGLVLSVPNTEHQRKFNPQCLPKNRVAVESFLAKVLRPYQKEGVNFLYECVMGMRGDYPGQYWGAILADEPGLGKTLTCIALMWTLLEQKLYGSGAELNRILIITPKSLVDSWEKDINKWLESRVEVFKVDGKKNHLRNQTSSSKITIISYNLFVHQAQFASNVWDLMICDEAHVLKNPETNVVKIIANVNCCRKIFLTGTPFQNNLMEFYDLLNLANPGCLGTKQGFGRKYANPARNGRLGKERMKELDDLTKQYMLRRTRELIIDYLPPKQDLIVMCKPAFVQRELYYLAAELWRQQRFESLPAIHILQQIGAHPLLMGQQCECPVAVNEDEDTTVLTDKSFSDTLKTLICQKFRLRNYKVDANVEASGKLDVLFGILQQLHCRFYTSCKDRVLIVSYFCQTLDFIQMHCKKKGFTFVRLDGSTSQQQRTALVKEFNENDQIFIFLMSAKAGGTGLNLPGASRVILFDMNWNPALDEQALARCWRGDQKRPVITYRLVTAGTLEEKLFQRQIQKLNLNPGVLPDTLDIYLPEETLKDIFMFQDDDKNLTHDFMLSCTCDGSGKDYKPVTKQHHHNLGINELRNWRHLKPSFNECVLTELDMNKAAEAVTFIFRSVVSPVTDEAKDCD